MKLEELGRRAVACNGWRWMPGMRIVNPQRATFGHGRKAAARYCTLGLNDEAFILESKNAGSMDTPSKNEEDWHPDLSDPATLGCLLALVEEQHGNVVLNESGGEWECWIYLGNGRGMFQYSGGNRIEALVAALEAAP